MSQKTDTVLKAERMVDEMCESMTVYALAKISGLNYLTLQHIAKGDARRVSGKVFAPLQKFYEDWKVGKMPPAPERGKPGRKAKTADIASTQSAPDRGVAPSATSGSTAVHSANYGRPDPSTLPFIRLDAIEAEIDRLEKRIAMLKELLELAKGL